MIQSMDAGFGGEVMQRKKFDVASSRNWTLQRVTARP